MSADYDDSKTIAGVESSTRPLPLCVNPFLTRPRLRRFHDDNERKITQKHLPLFPETTLIALQIDNHF